MKPWKPPQKREQESDFSRFVRHLTSGMGEQMGIELQNPRAGYKPCCWRTLQEIENRLSRIKSPEQVTCECGEIYKLGWKIR